MTDATFLAEHSRVGRVGRNDDGISCLTIVLTTAGRAGHKGVRTYHVVAQLAEDGLHVGHADALGAHKTLEHAEQTFAGRSALPNKHINT